MQFFALVLAAEYLAAIGLLVFSLVMDRLAVLGFSSIMAIFLFLVLSSSLAAKQEEEELSPTMANVLPTIFLLIVTHFPPLFDSKLFQLVANSPRKCHQVT